MAGPLVFFLGFLHRYSAWLKSCMLRSCSTDTTVRNPPHKRTGVRLLRLVSWSGLRALSMRLAFWWLCPRASQRLKNVMFQVWYLICSTRTCTALGWKVAQRRVLELFCMLSQYPTCSTVADSGVSSTAASSAELLEERQMLQLL